MTRKAPPRVSQASSFIYSSLSYLLDSFPLILSSRSLQNNQIYQVSIVAIFFLQYFGQFLKRVIQTQIASAHVPSSQRFFYYSLSLLEDSCPLNFRSRSLQNHQKQHFLIFAKFLAIVQTSCQNSNSFSPA